MTARTAALAALFLLSTAGLAVEIEAGVPLLYRSEAFGASTDGGPPLRVAESMASAPAQSLTSAFEVSIEQLDALAQWNREGRLPAKNGFSRPLLRPLDLRTTAAELENQVGRQVGGGWLAQTSSSFVWGAAVEVDGAYRLRLELQNLRLPADARLWMWGEGETPIEFGPENIDASGAVWSPSAAGPVAYLEVSWPRGTQGNESVRLSVTRVLEIFVLDSGGAAARERPSSIEGLTTACVVNAACVTDSYLPGISQIKKSVAHIQFVDSGSSFICSGNLLNNTLQNGTPYFLTANHCMDVQATAGTVEAFWDYIATGCPGSVPSLEDLPRSIGSTLLATSTVSDFSLLRLTSLPPGRAFLGWTSNTAATVNGTIFPRLHHPLGAPMAYSESTAWTPPTTCPGLGTANFVYSDPAPDLGKGATFGGSSGSSLFLSNGQVVGQLGGGCGPQADEPCLAGPSDSDYDGRFSVTYPSISQYLSPAGGSPCVAGPTTACLLSGRFKVEVEWTDFSAVTRDAFVASAGTSDTALFYWTNPNNWELLIKGVNACSFNNKFWIYFAAATNVGYRVTVTDTVAGGAPKVYTNAVGNLAQATNDISAFNCP